MIPTVSQARTYDTAHFIDAATHWEDLADRWSLTYGQVHAEAQGLPWEGLGAEALHDRISSDHRIAKASAERLRGAARIARAEAPNLSAMHRRLLYKLEDAQKAGFTVGEDWSVADKRGSRNATERAERRAQAQAFAADLRFQAGALYARDTEVSGHMTDASAGVNNWADTGVYHKTNGSSDYVQFVGHEFKQDGGTRSLPQPPNPGLPQPLQDFENQVQGLPPTPTPHQPVTVDDVRRQLQVQHDEYLEQLIRDAQNQKCTTHDVIKGLGELALASGAAIGGGVTAETGAGLYLGLATALGSGALAVDDLAKCLP